jgi:hypothetical protein
MGKVGAPEGNNNATKHGGAGAIKRIEKGMPFIGIAHEAEAQVQAEYMTDGAGALELRNAQRLQAAADLYWGAVSKAAEAGDLQAIDKYIQRYGWLASLALRAWTEMRKKEQSNSGIDAGKVLEVIKREKKEEK